MQRGISIIAGGGSGLGANFAQHALDAGYSVALLGRTENKLSNVQQYLVKSGYEPEKISLYPVDLTSSKSTSQTINAIAQQGPISILLNCAATWMGNEAINNISSSDVQKALDLNFYTAFNTCKSVLDLDSTERAIPMTIINIGASASVRGAANFSLYAISKGALRQFSQSLAKEVGPQHIHVVHVIIDGLINNERTRKLSATLSDDKFMDMAAISKSIMALVEQDPSCWTFELDMRPFNEKW